MTTTSAGNGPSAGDGRDDGDDWGWFTPAQPATETRRSGEDADADAEADAGQNEQAGRARWEGDGGHDGHDGRGDHREYGGTEPGGGPVGPVVTGAGAGRARWAETPEEFAIPVPAPPGGDIPGAPPQSGRPRQDAADAGPGHGPGTGTGTGAHGTA
ncbi:hypothetical protein AN218_24670, partial [Streptomyces nanshensis]